MVSDSRAGDLAIGVVGVDPATLGNCWEANTFDTTAPNDIEVIGACGGDGTGDWTVGALNVAGWLDEEHPPSADYQTTPEPPAQPNMPDAPTAPPHPATDVPFPVDLEAITVPEAPA